MKKNNCFTFVKFTIFSSKIFMSLIVILGNSCVERSLSNTAHSIMVQKNENLYRDRAMQFVRWIQQGEVESMLLYTSRLTIQTSETKNIKELYINEVIPKFKGQRVRWGVDSEMIKDEYGNSGMRFFGWVTGDQSFKFSVDVFGESGELMIINVRRLEG